MRVFLFNMNTYPYHFIANCFHSTAKNKYLIRNKWYILKKELRWNDHVVGEEGLVLFQDQRREEAPASSRLPAA